MAPGLSLAKLCCDAAMLVKVLAMRVRRRYDVIHGVEEAAMLAWLMSWFSRTPYVFDMDSSMPQQIADKLSLPGFVRQWLERVEAMGLRRSVGVLAVCKSLEDRARAAAPRAKVLRLEDISLLDHDAEVDEDLRASLGLAGNVLLYVGNFEPYQGIDLLLEALARGVAEHPEMDLVLIGGTQAHIAQYQDQADTLGIAGKTHFIGPRPVDKLAAYLRQADVLVSPRTQGGNTPMKVYSYLDSGVAVLATDLDTHTQAMDPQIAVLAPPEPDAFGQAMVRLCRDPGERAKLAAAATRRVAERYSKPAYRAKLGSFYESLREAETNAWAQVKT